MNTGNGTKTAMYSTIMAILLGLTGWSLMQIVELKTGYASAQTEISDVKAWMSKLDSKIDKLLDKR